MQLKFILWGIPSYILYNILYNVLYNNITVLVQKGDRRVLEKEIASVREEDVVLPAPHQVFKHLLHSI